VIYVALCCSYIQFSALPIRLLLFDEMISCASAVTMTITTAEHSYKTMQKTRKHKRYVCVPMLLAFVTLALDTVLWGVEDGRGKGRTVANQEQTRT
jgi:hypothetical protein